MLGICVTIAAAGCGNRETPSPATPVDMVSSNRGATDVAKEQAAMQQMLARRKQQEALQHNVTPPPIPPQ